MKRFDVAEYSQGNPHGCGGGVVVGVVVVVVVVVGEGWGEGEEDTKIIFKFEKKLKNLAWAWNLEYSGKIFPSKKSTKGCQIFLL